MMHHAARFLRNEKGLTLIEVMVTGLIAAILMGGIFATFQVVASSTEQASAQQQLRMESAYINEYVSRWTAAGCSLQCTHDGDPDTFNQLVIFNPINGDTLRKVWVRGDTLMENGARLSTPFGALVDTMFCVIDPNGRFAHVVYRLYFKINGRIYFYPMAMAAGTCKNRTRY